MKNFATSNFRKIIVSLIFVAFGFSLQSFIGVRIEKRHYRKGYYVHIWHNPKTKPIHTATEKVVVKQEMKEEKIISTLSTAQQKEQDAPSSHDDYEPQRNIAPVSRAINDN